MSELSKRNYFLNEDYPPFHPPEHFTEPRNSRIRLEYLVRYHRKLLLSWLAPYDSMLSYCSDVMLNIFPLTNFKLTNTGARKQNITNSKKHHKNLTAENLRFIADVISWPLYNTAVTDVFVFEHPARTIHLTPHQHISCYTSSSNYILCTVNIASFEELSPTSRQ